MNRYMLTQKRACKKELKAAPKGDGTGLAESGLQSCTQNAEGVQNSASRVVVN